MIAGPAGSALSGSVLVLNKFYSAIHVLGVPKAFCLLCKGAAEVVDVDRDQFASYDFCAWLELCELRSELGEAGSCEDWVRAVNFSVQVPRIIRLVRYDRMPRNAVKFNRRNVFLRDDHMCQYCGKSFGHSGLSLDHVMPRSRGGETSWENIVAACLKCNVKKGGRTPQEAGMRLRNHPSKPRRNPALTRQLSLQKYAAWRRFV